MIKIDLMIKNALKNKQSVELKVYRNLKADMMAFKTQKNAPEYDEVAELNIIKKYLAKVEDAKEQFTKAQRFELAEEYQNEINVLQTLLPQAVDQTTLFEELLYWATKNQYLNIDNACKVEIPKKEMGNAIKYLKNKFPAEDGARLSKLVKECVI